MKKEIINKILLDAESIKTEKEVSDETKIKILEESLRNKKKEMDEIFYKIKKDSNINE